MNNGSKGPLSGIKVLDLSSVVVGPTATLILVEQGAEVIKIESPTGDLIRHLGGAARSPNMSPKFLQFNSGKKSVCLDLKKDSDRSILYSLIADIDVVVTNMRSAALDRLGIDYQTLAKLKPNLVYCAIVGFGEGPYRDRPAYDTVVQGGAGIAACMEQVFGRPAYVPFVMADHLVGILASQAITAALYSRTRTGQGDFIEVPMYENTAAFVLREHFGARAISSEGGMGDLRVMNANAAPLRTLDGHICISPNTDAQVMAFFEAIGRPELKSDERLASVRARLNNLNFYQEIRRDGVSKQTTAYWLDVFSQRDIPALPYNTLEELLVDPQIKSSGIIVERDHPAEGRVLQVHNATRFTNHPTRKIDPAPTLGQHNKDYLSGA